MKPGRNDPCPCGSGKKYKQCCLASETRAADSPDEIAWRRLRRVLEGFPGRMLDFVMDAYGKAAIEEAWDEYLGWPEEATPVDMQHAPVFFPWLYHCWSPDPQATEVQDRSLHGVPPTQAYLQRQGERLDPALRRYLQACLVAPLTFHEIVSCRPGHGFHARELITGTECDVLERSASQTMRVGDMLFGSVAACDGIALLEACAPRGIPPIDKIKVVQLRQRINAGSPVSSLEQLCEWDAELRDVYLEVVDALLNPSLPELRNTDDEALSLQRLIYDIDSPEAAFVALKHLALGDTEADLRAGCDLDAEGKLARISFDWRKPGNRVHQSWSNTVLGNIEINSRRLTVQVNSAERAEQIKRIIGESLGEQARYRATEVQSMERMLSEARASGTQPVVPDDPDQIELMQRPEVQAQLHEMLSRHYEGWLHQSIPALGGRTPLQAVQDAVGREMVEALLAQIERNTLGPAGVDQSVFVRRLRERLGLVGNA